MKVITVKDMIKFLEGLNRPNAKLVYSSDEEGNSFHFVYFMPTIGKFKEEDTFRKINAKTLSQGEFTSEGSDDYDTCDGQEVVCIN